MWGLVLWMVTGAVSLGAGVMIKIGNSSCIVESGPSTGRKYIYVYA